METKLEINKNKEEIAVSTENSSLRKNNILIGAKYMASLTELRVTYIAMLKIQQGKFEERPDGIYVSMQPSEIKEYLVNGSDSHRIYERLNQAAANMTGRTIGFTDQEAGTFQYHALITDSYYENHTLTIQFNPKLKEQLIVLIEKGNWSKLDRKTVMSFKSAYSFRLYEILKKYCYYPKNYTGERTNMFSVIIGLSELKFEMGVINSEIGEAKRILNGSSNPDYIKAEEKAEDKISSYGNWDNFKRRCLDVAVKEINEKAEDMQVSYKRIPGSTLGGKTSEIKFVIDTNKTKKNVENKEKIKDENKNYLVVNEIFGNIFTEEECKAIYKKCKDKKVLKDIKEYYDEYPKNLYHPAGWIIELLNKGFKKPTKKQAKPISIAFNNFEQRSYDFDELEKNL